MFLIIFTICEFSPLIKLLIIHLPLALANNESKIGVARELLWERNLNLSLK